MYNFLLISSCPNAHSQSVSASSATSSTKVESFRVTRLSFLFIFASLLLFQFLGSHQWKWRNPLEALISEKMFKSAPKMGSYKLGDSTLSSMIENYANSGDFASVEKLLIRIRLENRVIVEHSFIVVFRAYGKAHLPEKVVDLFHRMVYEFRCKRSGEKIGAGAR